MTKMCVQLFHGDSRCPAWPEDAKLCSPGLPQTGKTVTLTAFRLCLSSELRENGQLYNRRSF